ncbi:response regulator [Streptomyces sp. NPDC059909]|uniref:response regulator n=1 Tax=Streptomyces sp. NPDC059909 TaxID=3346998 RepID=UPI0036551774
MRLRFPVVAAATGSGALTAAESARPDVVVLDVMLPDVDGFEVAARPRAAGRNAPVLFLTARDSVDDRIRGLSSEGNEGHGPRPPRGPHLADHA